MSTILTGVFDIMPVADGSQTFPQLEVEGAASQSYSGNTYYPDWKTQPSLRPKFTPHCYDGVEGSVNDYQFLPGIATNAGAVSTANQQWYYNNTGIIWSQVGSTTKYRSSNFLSADGTTPLMELDLSNPNRSWVTFIGNIPTTLSQGDDDVLRFVGKVDGIEGFTVDVSRTIRVSELAGGTGNKVDIILSKTNFDNDMNTNDSITVNVGAVINNEYKVGFSAINAAGYKVSFASSIGINKQYFRSGDPIVPSSVTTLTLLPDDIGGEGTIICNLLDAQNSVVAVDSMLIKDLGDPDIVHVESFTVASAASTTPIDMRNGSIKKDEFLRCIAKVTDRTGTTDKTALYTFTSAAIKTRDGVDLPAETAKITDYTEGGKTYKVYVVDFATAYGAGGLRFIASVQRNS